MLQFLTRQEIKFGGGLPMKLREPCYREVENTIEFRSLSLTAVSLQELSIQGLVCVARNRFANRLRVSR